MNLPLSNLSYLNLSYNKLGPSLASLLLKESFGLISPTDRLESLYLVETDLTDDFIEVSFLKAAGLANLRDIDLSHNCLSASYLKVTTWLQERCHLISNLSLASCKFYQAAEQKMGPLPRTYID